MEMKEGVGDRHDSELCNPSDQLRICDAAVLDAVAVVLAGTGRQRLFNGVDHDGHGLVAHSVRCHLIAGLVGLHHHLVGFLLGPDLDAVVVGVMGIAVNHGGGGAAGAAVQHDLHGAHPEMLIAAATVDAGVQVGVDVSDAGLLAEHVEDHGVDPAPSPPR